MRQCWTGFLVWITVSGSLVLLNTELVRCVNAIGDDDYKEFVEEILEEDDWHHDEDNPFFEDPPPDPEPPKEDYHEERLRRKREEERLKQQAEVERLQRQKAEEAFAKELKALPDEQQKLLRQKKRKDGKIVQGILNAWQRHDFYAVLGLRRFFPEGIRLIKGHGGKPGVPQKLNIKNAILKRQWPDVIILRIPTRAIQQAYRTRAVQTHPDKNRDPRTEQAFVAVQDAHKVLSDPELRKAYEMERQTHRLAVRQAWKDRYHKVINTTLRPVLVVLHKVVGPLTVPLVVVGALVF
eukprot:scaffold16756_cov148-Amphora_coffeaeformis.AAC.2